jgi:peptidyl-prolyl cis-trans isomerase C
VEKRSLYNKLVQWLKEPLLQFLIIGAGIYGFYALYGAPEDDGGEMIVEVDANRIASFVNGWQSRMNRPPTESELDAAIQQYIKEEILYREAVAMGLGENDPITRRRLAQKLEFLTKDVARLKEPAEGELEAWFEEHKADYRDPDLITFTHVFIDPDQREETTLDDAAVILTELQASGEPNADSPKLGDRFMLQSYYPQKTALAIRKQFGSGFTESVLKLEPGQWHGPVLSGYGVHLVYVHALDQAEEPQFAAVKERVFEDWQVNQQETFNKQYIESLKSRYEIVIDRDVLSTSSLRSETAKPSALEPVTPAGEPAS